MSDAFRIPPAPAPGIARPCPICRLPRENTISAGNDADPGRPQAVVCSGCGVVYVSPIPASAVDPGHYDGDYYRPWQEDRPRGRARLWRRRVAAILARTDPGTLLDVGCGDGQFLKTARAAGFAVDGIEYSAEGARRSAETLGRPVAIGDLAAGRGLAGPFRTITLWHVLEHVADPSRLLAAVRARLAPGGLLAVAVPNLENLPLRAIYRLVRRRPLPLFEPDAREPHLTHFSPSTLAATLERHGFTAIEVVRDRCALDLPKRLIDAGAALLSRLSGRLMVDAIVAYARNP